MQLTVCPAMSVNQKGNSQEDAECAPGGPVRWVGDFHILGTAISFSTFKEVLIGKIAIANSALYMNLYIYGV